ncbi:MAG: hypothetical protein JWM91_5243 [Rhodospirillales bacterium]|nr:hypothetical protein [Rhodospirillales bacterium]
MTLFLIILIGWGVLSPFVIANGLKARIEKLEAQVAALRAGKPPPLPDSVPVAPQPITPLVTQAPPVVALSSPFTPAARPGAPSPAPAPNPAWEAIEHWLVERWIIAAGGLTAALGGLFIVRYSIEQGLLGPAARTILGALVGLALIGGAEWVRQRSVAHKPEPGPIPLHQVPAALSAAGLVTLYGVVYAAHAFYDLMPATMTFILLAIVAFGSLAAGLLYGPLAATLGAGMGLIAPALVASDNPNAAILFPYLFIVTAGIFAVIRYRTWPWLAWLALAGNGIWQLSWMLSVGGGQGIIRVAHLLAIPVLSFWLLLREPWPEPAGPWWRWDWSKAPLPVWTVSATVLGSFGLLWLLAAGTGYGGTAATGWGVGLAMLLLLARSAPTQQPILPIAALMTVGLTAAWTVPAMTPDEAMPWLMRGPLLAPTLAAYVAPVAIYAALFGVGGFVLLWRSSQPGVWASVSASVPLALLALLYARLSGLVQSLPWASVGIGLAALALAAAERAAHRRPPLSGALAAYAAAVTTAIALAAAMALHAAWLTVALALELPALAWIWRKSRSAQADLPSIRILAGIIAAILTVRLILNPHVADYAGDMPILWNWLLYGYGIPALACWAAARWFRSEPGDGWVETLLQAAALAFGTALMSLELWHTSSGEGRLFATGEPLGQVAAIGNGWLALGFLLLRLDRNGSNAVRHWGWQLIGGAGLAWTLLMTLLAVNPIWSPFGVGATPILNLVLLAYGLPALLLWAGADELARQHQRPASQTVTAAAVSLSIATVLLEIRQAFHGSRLDGSGMSQAETYSYSAGILLISLGLLAGGLRWPKSDLRLAGFALLALTLGKAFLIDMDDLTGLWRAASFLGLGLCLIGVGYAYQKFQPGTAAASPPTA